jgi:hypothetical protein
MSSLPNVKKDANGFPIVAGVQERTTTQEQADYTDIQKSLSMVTGIDGDNAREAFKNNPGTSPGVITSVIGAGASANNGILKILAQIDQQTKAKRAEDARIESARISTEKFDNTLAGKAWRLLKDQSRKITVFGNAITETLSAQTRLGLSIADANISGIKEQGLDWFTSVNVKNPSAELQAKIDKVPAIQDIPKSIASQTTLGQVLKGLVDTGELDLGNGFFPSEETGAGFAARKQQLKYNKQAFEVNGETYYRPYSFMDPFSSVLSLGHPESSFARVINAIGEIGISVALDPFLAVSKIKAAKQAAELVLANAKGMKAVKAAESVSVISAQLEEAQRSVKASFEAMGLTAPAGLQADAKLAKGVFSAKTAKGVKAVAASSKAQEAADAYKAAYSKFNKLADEFNNIDINYDDIASFLSGAKGTHILDALANADSYLQIQKLAKGKFTVDEAIALAKATTREEVLATIAPFIANGNVQARALDAGTRTGRALRGIANNVSESAIGSIIAKGENVAIQKFSQGAAARAITRMSHTSKIAAIGQAFESGGKAVVASKVGQKAIAVGRKRNAFLPDRGGSFIHIDNKDKLIEAVNNVGRYMNLPKTVLDKIITDIAYSATSSESGFQATAKLFDAIFENSASKFTGEELEAFRAVTRVFESNRNEMSKYWASQHATGADITFGLVGGGKVTLHSSHLDSELLNAFVYIPDPKEIADFLKQAKRLGTARLAASDVASSLNAIWKKSVMVRPAYISRNIIEEQIRVFGIGHISFFNRPGAALAMWLGRDDGPQWKQFLNRFDETKNDIHGDALKMGTAAEEFASEQLAGDLINHYASFMSDSSLGSSGDGVINKLVRSLGYTSEEFGHPLWWQGYASQMRVLHNSDFVRRVIATKPGDEMETVNYFLKGKGRPTLDKFIGLKDEEFKAFANTEDGLMKYLFTGTNELGKSTSVLARIEEMAGGGSHASIIKQLILKGTVKIGDTTVVIPNGKTIAEHNLKISDNVTKGVKKSKIKKDINTEFSKTLEKMFANGGDWSGVKMTLPSRESRVQMKLGESIGDIGHTRIVKPFFDASTRLEKTSTMGPEWRQAYWDKVGELSHALDTEGIATLRAQAPKSLGTLRDAVTKKVIGTNHKAFKNLDKASGDGVLTSNDVHEIASKFANTRVSQLFYNAQKRNLLWHQLRLIVPFGQAWEDTMKAWGKIALNDPAQVYKASKVLNWANSSSSSALYELTDAKSYYDPNQGIFFKDPTTGERKFFVPFASTALNVLQGLVPGASDMRLTGPMQFTAQPQSFNFALGGGSVFPGMGFGVTWGLGALSAMNKNPLKILPPQWEEYMYKTFFPYGTPDVKNAGLFEGALLTANWARIAGAVFGVESSYASAFAPSMGYLASSGDYDLNNPDDQQRLVRDGDNMAQYFTMWRGITGALTPIPFAMRPEPLARNKDGYTVLATSLWTDFKNMEVAAGGDRTKAYADFLDTYGPEQVFAITKVTTGYEPTNLATYALIKRDPSVLTKYKDSYGYFYPNGELSMVLYEFQQQRGSFNKLSAQKIMDKATNIRYSAAKDRMETRAVGEGWSSSQHATALAAIDDTYNRRGLIKPLRDTQWFDRVIVQLESAVNDPGLADSDVITGARAYLVQRNKALAAAGTKTLKNKASARQREWLASEAKTLIEKYPDFQKIFYGVFKRELEG